MGDDEYGPATAARAKWDFVPEEPSGLALTADDELEVWPTEKGWWFARKKRGGYEGYVPRDYVRVEGRHAEAAFPGLSARVATISPRRAEPPRNDDDDELQLALALSLSEAEAASARPPPRPVSSPRSPPSPALSEVVEVLTPPTRASAPPPSPSFTEARRPPPPPPLELFDAEALADAALAEVLPPAAPPLPPREPEAMPSPESKPTSPRDGGPRRQSLLKSARRSIRRSLGIPKPAKASPAEVARLRRQAAAAEAEATRLRGALEASTPLDESTECQVCMARAKDTALVPCGHVLCAECVTRSNDARLVEECPVCRETVQSTMRVYI